MAMERAVARETAMIRPGTMDMVVRNAKRTARGSLVRISWMCQMCGRRMMAAASGPQGTVTVFEWTSATRSR